MSSTSLTHWLAGNGRRHLDSPFSAARAAVVVAVLLVSALAPRAAMAQQVSVDQIELFLTPGDPSRSSAVFNVANEGDTRQVATLYTADWQRDSVGGQVWLPLGTLKESCRGMVQIFPTQLPLEPHSQQAVRVTLVGADTLKAACWSIVFVELQPVVNMQGRGRAVQAVLRLGTHIYVEPRNLQRSADIQDMRLANHAATQDEMQAGRRVDTVGRKDIVISFKNTGTAQIRPSGRVEIRRPDNSTVTSLKIEEFPVLPNGTRQLRVPIPTLASGKYVALAILDFGGADIAGGQVEFQMP